MLAHHYLSALKLSHAADQDATDLAQRARPALQGAGDRALALNAFAAAVGYYRAALGLWPEDARKQRAGLLFQLALALGGAGEDDDGTALGQARLALLEVGDSARAAEADARLGELWWLKGHRDHAFEHLGRAQALVRDEPASAGKAYVLSELARYRRDAPWFAAAHALADQEFARAAGLPDSMGAARSAALVRLRAAQELAKADGPADVDDHLRHALSFFRSVGATRFIREAETLLAASA
jgi:tetratricopeptide (TPR) repeat protein